MTSGEESLNKPDDSAPAVPEGAAASMPAPGDPEGSAPAGDESGRPAASESPSEALETPALEPLADGAGATPDQPDDAPADDAPADDGSASDDLDDTDDDADLRPLEEVQPVSEIVAEDEELKFDWYILKVQVNREDSIRDALLRRVKVAGLEEYFGDVIVPTEDVAEFNKSGKRRIVKKKLYPGYIMVNMSLNDETWFLVRETPGIGDFTGSAGKPTAMDPHEVERIIRTSKETDTGDTQVRTAIPFKPSDRVRVKEGYFENFEGDVETVDEANGRVTVMINIFGRSTPVELEHWQIEAV